MDPLEHFYFSHDELNGSCFMALRDFILNFDPEIKPEWKYKCPFFYYKNKMMCFLWYSKKYNKPYIGWVDGNQMEFIFLLQEDRAKMKIMLIDSNKDLPIHNMKIVLSKAIVLLEEKIKLKKGKKMRN